MEDMDYNLFYIFGRGNIVLPQKFLFFIKTFPQINNHPNTL